MPVIIGMDPHKRSATIEVINELGNMITAGEFGTDQIGYAEMLATGRRFSDLWGARTPHTRVELRWTGSVVPAA